MELKKLLATNKALLYVGLLYQMEIAILVNHIHHIKLIVLHPTLHIEITLLVP